MKQIHSLTEFEANNTSKYSGEINEFKTKKTNSLVNEAITDQGQSKFKVSAEKLFTAYKLSGEVEYLYFAASGYVSAKDYKNALPMYIELKDMKYFLIK